MIVFRKAIDADAGALSELLCRSITELCSADHRNDPDVIARWTANKSPEYMMMWIRNPRHFLVIAERDQEPAGVGCISDDGEVLLNYVSPDHRFCGVSKAVLDHLEEALAERGITRASLTSTKTAHQFYRKARWVDCAEPEVMFGLTGYPMEKLIFIIAN